MLLKIALTVCVCAFILNGCSRPGFHETSSSPSESYPSSSVFESSTPSASQAPASSSQEPVVLPAPDWRLTLVNYNNPIPTDWNVELTMTKYGYEVDARIVDDVDTLVNAAATDGVTLILCYGYRTLEQSQQLFEKQLKKQLSYGLTQEAAYAEAKRWVAPPGTSDHHTGLALDIVTPEHQVLNHQFANTRAGVWLEANSWKYGFVIRFPKDKQDITGITYEPWHLRFVGVTHAAAMHENDECLEEYVARIYGGEAP